MGSIFIGNTTKLFYNSDAGNNIPNAPTYTEIDQLGAFPQVKINSSTETYETYNEEYVSVLASNKSIDSVNIVVHYVPDNESHQFLDRAFDNSTRFQIKVSLYESQESLDQHYVILNGYVSSTNLSGARDSVVDKTYVFNAEEVVARGTAKDPAPLKVGDYGVGANGSADIPQYESETPSGNSFIKVPSDQQQNPTGVDMLGIAGVDDDNITKLAITENGSLGIYAKNQSSDWQQILTKQQMDGVYVPLTRTINGKSLSSNISLTSADTGSLALTGGTLTGEVRGTGMILSNGITATNIVATNAITADTTTTQTLNATKGNFTNVAVEQKLTASNVDLTGKLTAGSIELVNPLAITHGGTGNKVGNAPSATKLNTARTIGVDLESKTDIPFDGTANVRAGIFGILPITNGGTGSNTLAGLQTNLQIDRYQQNASETSIFSPDRISYLTISNDSWGVYSNNIDGNNNGGWKPLAIGQGGTGAITVDGVRSNLQLGKTQESVFQDTTLIRSGTSTSGTTGILSVRKVDTNGATISQSRLYNEYQGSLNKTTIHTAANGKNAYLQFDENADLYGAREIKLSGSLTADLSVWAGQSNVVGVGTKTGGDKNIFLSNVTADGSSGSWVNYVEGHWYNDRWNLGSIRTDSSNIKNLRLQMSTSNAGSALFDFYPTNGGYMSAGRGVMGQCIQGGWGIEGTSMGAPFFANTVLNNDGGWSPIVAGGSQSTGGYSLRAAFGVISNGNNRWPDAAIKLLGDGTYNRGFQFTVTGDIVTWGNGSGFEGSYIFTKAANSDKTLKYDISYTNGKESYDRVSQWLPTLFKYNGQETQRYGFIAQDLQKVDEQYVKEVQGYPIFEEVLNDDGEVIGQKQTGMTDSTLALDTNVMLTDLACAFRYVTETQQKEIDDLKSLVTKLMNK